MIGKWILILQRYKNQNLVVIEPNQSILTSSGVADPHIVSGKNYGIINYTQWDITQDIYTQNTSTQKWLNHMPSI